MHFVEVGLMMVARAILDAAAAAVNLALSRPQSPLQPKVIDFLTPQSLQPTFHANEQRTPQPSKSS